MVTLDLPLDWIQQLPLKSMNADQQMLIVKAGLMLTEKDRQLSGLLDHNKHMQDRVDSLTASTERKAKAITHLEARLEAATNECIQLRRTLAAVMHDRDVERTARFTIKPAELPS